MERRPPNQVKQIFKPSVITPTSNADSLPHTMNESITPETKTTKPLERIGNYDVHPVASIFPMMSAKEERDLCDSISVIGLQEPVVVHEGLLIDGRNRVKACLACQVPVRTVEWSKVAAHHHLRNGKGDFEDFPATTVDQWIMAKNIDRRNLTPDQIASVWAQHGLWEEEEEAKERRARKPQDSASLHSDSQTKDRNAGKTTARIAKKAGVSRHKAEQAVKLVKAVEAGTAPMDDLELVKAGLKKMTDAVRPLKPEKPKLTLEESVHRDMVRFMDRYAVADHEQVKQLVTGFFRKK
jgi:hypothetical protein